MPQRDAFAEQMQKAVQEHNAQREEEERFLRRHERMANIRKWCILILLVLVLAYVTVYRGQVSARMTAIRSAVFPGDKGNAENKGLSGLSPVKAFDHAKQALDHAKNVNAEREKILGELNSGASGAQKRP